MKVILTTFVPDTGLQCVKTVEMETLDKDSAMKVIGAKKSRTCDHVRESKSDTTHTVVIEIAQEKPFTYVTHVFAVSL